MTSPQSLNFYKLTFPETQFSINEHFLSPNFFFLTLLTPLFSITLHNSQFYINGLSSTANFFINESFVTPCFPNGVNAWDFSVFAEEKQWTFDFMLLAINWIGDTFIVVLCIHLNRRNKQRVILLFSRRQNKQVKKWINIYLRLLLDCKWKKNNRPRGDKNCGTSKSRNPRQDNEINWQSVRYAGINMHTGSFFFFLYIKIHWK